MMLQFIAIPIMMLAICVVNLAWTHWKAENKLSLEGARLQAALVEELRLLCKLYHSNLELLAQSDAKALSTRIPMAIFRANIGRLTLLDEPVIKRLVAVHANNELLEMMIAQRAKSIKNGQCTVYLFEKEDPAIAEFKTLFEEAIAQVERAIASIDAGRGPDERPQPQSFALAGRILGFAEN